MTELHPIDQVGQRSANHRSPSMSNVFTEYRVLLVTIEVVAGRPTRGGPGNRS